MIRFITGWISTPGSGLPTKRLDKPPRSGKSWAPLRRSCLISTQNTVEKRGYVMKYPSYTPILLPIIILVVAAFTSPAYSQQAPSRLDLDRSRVMLKAVKDDLKNNYYDPA